MGAWGESGWSVGLLFHLLACVVEGSAICCLVPLGFSEPLMPLWCVTNICYSATARLRHPFQDIDHKMKLGLPGCWGFLIVLCP